VILEVHNETSNEKYLGLSSDVSWTKNGFFSYLKDRIWKRLQGWMERLLSGGGKEILSLLFKLYPLIPWPFSNYPGDFANTSHTGVFDSEVLVG
jgi:hypothetical protein